LDIFSDIQNNKNFGKINLPKSILLQNIEENVDISIFLRVLLL